MNTTKAHLPLGIICLAALIIMTLLAPVVEHNAPRLFSRLRTGSLPSDSLVTESMYARVFHAPSDSEFVPMITRSVDFYLPLLLTDFGMQHNSATQKATIIIYSDADTYVKALGGKLPSGGNIDELPMGAYGGGIIHILTPLLWTSAETTVDIKDDFLQQGPIIHELTHFLTDRKVSGSRSSIRPWLMEGIALYYETKYTGREWMPELASAAAAFPYEEMVADFQNADADTAYRKAFETVNAFVRIYGEQTLQDSIDTTRCVTLQ